MHKLGIEGFEFGGLGTISLLYAEYLVLLASSGHHLHLGWDETQHFHNLDHRPQPEKSEVSSPIWVQNPAQGIGVQVLWVSFCDWLLIYLCPHSHLWSTTVGSGRKPGPTGARGLELVSFAGLLRITRSQVRRLRYFGRMPPSCLPDEVYWPCSTRKGAQGRPPPSGRQASDVGWSGCNKGSLIVQS